MKALQTDYQKELSDSPKIINLQNLKNQLTELEYEEYASDLYILD